MVSIYFNILEMFLCVVLSQTKINLTKMESFQRYKTSVEGQD